MLTNICSLFPEKSRSPVHGVRLALQLLGLLLVLAGCVTGARQEAMGGSGDMSGVELGCASQRLPPDWPEASVSSEDLLAPFLSCTSPADVLALQQRVDMPRLVARLDAWSAVRLGALGPVGEEVAHPLNRQRTTFLLQSLKRYGAANTEVLAHFVLDSAHDDDLREMLFLLAQDKRLTELLEQLPSLGPALEARGLKPSAHAERDFQWSDVGRGLGRAGEDALATSPVVNGAQSTLGEFDALKEQLPPPYQRALEAVEHEQLEQQFSAGNLAVGFLDHMTFGVPLGFYGLVAGTGHGAYSLSRGRYEQAVRELAPAAVLVALYAGGRSAAWLSEAREMPGLGTWGPGGRAALELQVAGLRDVARRARELLGEEGLRELAGYLRARREAGRLVAVGGMDAALALHEARGNVAQAQAMLSKAHGDATSASTGRGRVQANAEARAPLAEEAVRTSSRGAPLVERPESLASLVDAQVGLTPDVVRAKLAVAELESTSARLSGEVEVLERHRPGLESPPAGAQGNPRWTEYVAYYEGRLTELKNGETAQGPLTWEAYTQLRGWFARGLAFERDMVRLLKEDASRPRAERRYLGDFDKPRVEANVGVKKPGPGLRYADVLVIEERELTGQPRRVETFSFKSRNLVEVEEKTVKAQLLEDAREAMRNYGQTLEIRRDSLRPLFTGSNTVRVSRTRLIYEGGALMPRAVDALERALNEVRNKVKGVEVSFQ